MWPNPQEVADLVTFTEEILNGKFNFLCTDLKLDVQGQRGGIILDDDRQGVLKIGQFSRTPYVYHPLVKQLIFGIQIIKVILKTKIASRKMSAIKYVSLVTNL